MANYLSFHAGVEGKVKKADIKKMAGHTFRKTEKRYKSHGNEDIDMARTKYNIDWTLTNEPLDKLVEERLEKEYKGKRALRKDAVVVREIIVQASPSVYEGLSFEEQRKKALQFTNDSLKWFRKEFGSKNVVAASVHMDETNPHTHFVIMPMTKDGRLSQKDFFKGPADLKRQHKEYREHMIKLGWDFEVENKYENVDGLSLPKYKANAKAIEAKRIEQQDIIEELKGDRDLQQEAMKQIYDDLFNVVLKEKLAEMDEEKRQIEAKEKALRDLFLEVCKHSKYDQEKQTYNKVLENGISSISTSEFSQGLIFGSLGIVEKQEAEQTKRLKDNMTKAINKPLRQLKQQQVEHHYQEEDVLEL